MKYQHKDKEVVYARVSSNSRWEILDNVDACSFQLVFFHPNFKLLAAMLEASDLSKVCQTNYYVGECVMWTALLNNRADIVISLPVLRTIKTDRLIEREFKRQEFFELFREKFNR